MENASPSKEGAAVEKKLMFGNTVGIKRLPNRRYVKKIH
jgi:hypothetical protein